MNYPNSEAVSLSVEQQFKLRALREEIKNLSKEQSHTYLLEMFRQQMIKDNLIKHLFNSNQNF